MVLKSYQVSKETIFKQKMDDGLTLDEVENSPVVGFDTEAYENEFRKLEMQINHEAIVFSLKLQVLDRFNRQRLRNGQILSTYRVKIQGFDKSYFGQNIDRKFKLPEFNLLIRVAIIQKKMPKRKEEDVNTWDETIIIDGLKMQVINKDMILLKHGAMGAYQRQFDTVFLETKLAGDMASLNEGEELAPYEDDEYEIEKVLEDGDFMQDDIEDFIIGQTEGAGVDMVD